MKKKRKPRRIKMMMLVVVTNKGPYRKCRGDPHQALNLTQMVLPEMLYNEDGGGFVLHGEEIPPFAVGAGSPCKCIPVWVNHGGLPN